MDDFTTRLVICGNWHEFSNWLREDKFHGKNAVFVEGFKDLAGRNREKVEIIKYGTWYANNKAIREVERWLGTRID